MNGKERVKEGGREGGGRVEGQGWEHGRGEGRREEGETMGRKKRKEKGKVGNWPERGRWGGGGGGMIDEVGGRTMGKIMEVDQRSEERAR